MEAEDTGAHLHRSVTGADHHRQKGVEVVVRLRGSSANIPHADDVIISHNDPVALLLEDTHHHVVANIRQALVHVSQGSPILDALIAQVLGIGLHFLLMHKDVRNRQRFAKEYRQQNAGIHHPLGCYFHFQHK